MTDKDEVIEIVDEFLLEKGLWQHFKKFVEAKGYSVKELGFDDDPDT